MPNVVEIDKSVSLGAGPEIIRSSVVLPQPEGSIRVVKLPLSMVMEVFWITVFSPKDFMMSIILISSSYYYQGYLSAACKVYRIKIKNVVRTTPFFFEMVYD